MKGSLVKAAAMILPLAGLAGLWVQTDQLSRQGTDWQVPIEGYDPRDLLRGHYVEFTYDWPRELADGETDFGLWADRLCLFGNAPVIERVEAITSDAEFAACDHPLQAVPSGVYGDLGLQRGRLYVGQDRARELQDMLAKGDQRGIVTFRQRPDGVLTPLDITFRPLKEEEIAERDAPDEG